MTDTLEVSEEQALWFRARRGHLAGPGAKDAAAAASAIVGAQSQQIGPSLIALSQRTKGRPSAARLTQQILEEPRKLVRTWGQRETIFVFDPKKDWPLIAAVRPELARAGRRGPMPPDAAVKQALAVMKKGDGTATRSDVIDLVPASYVKKIADVAKKASMDPVRLGAGRLMWVLALNGECCVAEKRGTEQAYAARAKWFPKLAWPKKLPSPAEAGAELVTRYLAAYAPATKKDISSFFKANMSDLKQWIEPLEESDELTSVECGGRKGLIALKNDARELSAKPPTKASDWPLRLLPLWDSLMMGHADKTWLVPNDADRKRIWRAGAYVAATVLDRGRVVALWSQEKKAKRLKVEVEPLSGWRKAKHLAATKREAKAIADHLGLAGVDVVGV